MPVPWLLAGTAAGAVLMMLSLYAWQLRSRDVGVVDVGWSAGIGLAALWYAVASQGDLTHRIAAALLCGLWSFRLARYLLLDRVKGKGEDGRYAKLRSQWGEKATRNFLIFFLFQALLIVLFSLPPLFACIQSRPGLGVWDVIGLLIGFGAIAGEGLADRQLQRWRSCPENRGKTCRSGLWRYSRHPNYFFEWLHWWAYVFMTAGTFSMIGALLGPVLMFLFLYRLTGIPHTEAQALKSRGEDYRAYQRSTPAFFPWFPREHAE